MSKSKNPRMIDIEIYNNETIRIANTILLEYFRNNRYPKRIEKLKLAEKAGVSLQFVINFFCKTRSTIKNLEKRQTYLNTDYVNTYLDSKQNTNLYINNNNFASKKSDKKIKVLNGKDNNLYNNLPIVSTSILYEKNILNKDICSKIEMFDELNNENINNINE